MDFAPATDETGSPSGGPSEDGPPAGAPRVGGDARRTPFDVRSGVPTYAADVIGDGTVEGFRRGDPGSVREVYREYGGLVFAVRTGCSGTVLWPRRQASRRFFRRGGRLEASTRPRSWRHGLPRSPVERRSTCSAGRPFGYTGHWMSRRHRCCSTWSGSPTPRLPSGSGSRSAP